MLELSNDLLEILLQIESDEFTEIEELEQHQLTPFFGWCIEQYKLNDDDYYEGVMT